MIVGVPKEVKPDEYRVAMVPAGVEELTRAGRRRVMQHYSWDRVADKMHEMFWQVLRNKGAAALSQDLEFAA